MMFTFPVQHSLLVITLFFQSVNSQQFILTTSCGKHVVSGKSCSLICDTQSTSTLVISWKNGTQTTQIESSNCTNTGGLPFDYISWCPTPGVFNLTILNAQFGRDSHAWSCINPFGPGFDSNATDDETFVKVPLQQSSLVLTRTDTTIECSVVSSPKSNLSLFEITSSSSTLIATETVPNRTLDGLETVLSASIKKDGIYFCNAEYGDGAINSTISSPAPTTGSTVATTSSTNTMTVSEGQPPSTTQENKPPITDGTNLIIIIVISVAAFLLVVCCIIYCVVRRRKHKKKKTYKKDVHDQINKDDTNENTQDIHKATANDHTLKKGTAINQNVYDQINGDDNKKELTCTNQIEDKGIELEGVNVQFPSASESVQKMVRM